MKYLVWILLLFAAAVALTIASNNSAYMLLVYPPYRIEISFTMFVILAVLTFVSGYMLVRFTVNVLQLPSYVRKFRQNRANARIRKLQKEMLNAFFEGRYAEAEKAASGAIELGETSSIYPVIAARSAHELREFKARDAYLETVEDRDPGDTSLRLMTATKFRMEQHDPHGALQALQQLRDTGVKHHPGAMTLELKAQQQTGNWDAVLKLLDQMERRESIDATAAAQLRQQAWLEKIRMQKDLAGLNACLKNIPADFKRHSKIAAAAARALIEHGGCKAAKQLLTDNLNAQWDSELVALYGDCLEGDAVAQIEQAEKWLKLHQQDAGLLLALGKLCLHQKLWGKAQNYLDASISMKPGHEAYSALGQLSELLGKSDEAARYYQSAEKLK